MSLTIGNRTTDNSVFVLPLDAVTETFAILAKRGSGKTYAASVLAEEMLEDGQQVVIVDPVGVWFGLRSSADGKKPGHSVVIFGGPHADVPLQETAGQLIADVIIDHRISVVLDLSDFSKAASKRFMTDFAERLYHRNRDPLHLIMDEADAFAPQRVQHGGERLLGAIEDLVRRGRARGIGVTLITQRPAVLNKDVLTQAEVLVVLRMTGPRDVAAVDDWVSIHADTDEAKTVKASLPALKIGEAWVWSPGWLGALERIKIRRRHTFDSSSTPKAGQARPKAPTIKPIDIAELGERIQATVDQAQAENPRTLRARIAELERDLDNERRARASAEVQIERIEVPVMDVGVIDQLESALEPVGGFLQEMRDTLQKHRQWVDTMLEQTPPDHPHHPVAASHYDPTQDYPERFAAGDVYLKVGARRILETLARHHPMRVTKAQLGTLAKFKITGGTFQTYWSQIRRAGFIDENEAGIGITQAGLDYLGVAPMQPMTTADLQEMWRSSLKAGARLMLDELIHVYPRGYDKWQLAEKVSMTATGGTFQTYLSTLRRNGLIEDRSGLVVASDTLFLAR